MVNVFVWCVTRLCMSPTMVVESIPPERNAPKGTSLRNCSRTMRSTPHVVLLVAPIRVVHPPWSQSGCHSDGCPEPPAETSKMCWRKFAYISKHGPWVRHIAKGQVLLQCFRIHRPMNVRSLQQRFDLAGEQKPPLCIGRPMAFRPFDRVRRTNSAFVHPKLQMRTCLANTANIRPHVPHRDARSSQCPSRFETMPVSREFDAIHDSCRSRR